jgi:hypothetical protein
MQRYKIGGLSRQAGTDNEPQPFEVTIIAATPREACQAVFEDLDFHNREAVAINTIDGKPVSAEALKIRIME